MITKSRSLWYKALCGGLTLGQMIPKLTALFVLLASLLTVGGWALFPEVMRASAWTSGFHPLTATGLALVGFSLRLSRWESLNQRLNRMSVFLRLGIAGTGALAMTANTGLFGRDLVQRVWPTGVENFQPSAVAGFGLVLLGVTVLLKRTGRSLATSQTLLAVVALLGLTGLLGALYGASDAGSGLLMEPPAALLMLLAALALLSQQSHRGAFGAVVTDSTGRAIARRLLPASIVVPIALGWLRMVAENSGWISGPAGLLGHVLASIAIMAVIVWRSAAALARVSVHRQRAKQQWLDLEGSYRELLKLSDQPVFAYNSDGDVTFLNPAAERLFNTGPVEEGCMRMQTLVGTPAWQQAFAPLLLGASEMSRIQKIPIRRGNNIEFLIDVRVVHLYRAQGRFELLAVVRTAARASSAETFRQPMAQVEALAMGEAR